MTETRPSPSPHPSPAFDSPSSPFTLHSSPFVKADRQIAEWLFLLTFVVYGWFYAGGGWNQGSQFDLTRAIVERHTFAIDGDTSNTGDVARHGGHVYSNKSPALSWLAAIPYALLYALESNPSNPIVLGINNYLCTLAVVIP